MEVHIDFMDIENIYKNLVEVFGLSKEEITEYVKDFNVKHSITFNNLNKQINFTIPKLKINDITMSFYHVTTNNNKCQEVLEYGLRDLQYVCTENTQFKRFLNKHEIEIDIVNNTIRYKDELIRYIPDYKFYHNFENKVRPEAHLIFKLYKDQIVWGFREYESLNRYSCVHIYPEFLNDLNDALGVPNLLSDWLEDNNKAYLIKANVQLEKIDLCTLVSEDEDIVQKLIELMFKRLINDSPSESILLLKEGYYIDPNEIFEIKEL